MKIDDKKIEQVAIEAVSSSAEKLKSKFLNGD